MAPPPIPDTPTLKKWKNLFQPASFSSAEYLARQVAKEKGRERDWRKDLPGIAQDLNKSVLYQAHRNAPRRFARRHDVTTNFGQRWQADLADFGGAIPTEFSQVPFAKNKKQLFFLVCVDLFSHKVFARGLKNKTTSEVTEAFKNIIKSLKPPWRPPEQMETDAGKEFTGGSFETYLKEINAKHLVASKFGKAEVAERYIKSMKKVIFAAVQTGTYPKYQTWNAIVEAAANSLNGRYNRSISMSPNETAKHYGFLLDRERERLNLTPHQELEHLAKELSTPSATIRDDGKEWKIGTLVLIPAAGQGKLGNKEFYMKYTLKFYEISKIFFNRSPYLYKVRDPKTKQEKKRLFYAQEMKQIFLPPNIDPAQVVDHRIKPGIGLQYKLDTGEWIKAL